MGPLILYNGESESLVSFSSVGSPTSPVLHPGDVQYVQAANVASRSLSRGLYKPTESSRRVRDNIFKTGVD